MVKLKFEGPKEKLTGFRYWWLKYVRDFDENVHCAKSLVGPYSKKVAANMPMCEITLDEANDFSFIYLCGVSFAGYANNFHMAMLPYEKATGAMNTYNGYTVEVEGASILTIPALPDGYAGKTKAFTTCRNFQFGVHYLGALKNLT